LAKGVLGALDRKASQVARFPGDRQGLFGTLGSEIGKCLA
jgi:hypothetical protein